MSDKNFWAEVSNTCTHLAPAASQLLAALGQLAAAIDAADRDNRLLRTAIPCSSSIPEDDDE